MAGALVLFRRHPGRCGLPPAPPSRPNLKLTNYPVPTKNPPQWLRRSGKPELLGGNQVVEELLQRLDGQEVGRQVALSCRLLEADVKILRDAERGRDPFLVVNLGACHEQTVASTSGQVVDTVRANRALRELLGLASTNRAICARQRKVHGVSPTAVAPRPTLESSEPW